MLTLAAATLLAVTGLAACAGTGGAAPGPASGGAGATPVGGTGGGGVALARSRLYYLTKLSGGQLCGLLHPGEPAQISGGPTGPGTFVSYAGISVGCEWHSPTGFGGIHVDVPTAESWQVARAGDLAVPRSGSLTIDGHPAVGFQSELVKSAQVDVATAGPGDPVVSFGAPKMADAIKLAQIVMPRLLAITSTR